MPQKLLNAIAPGTRLRILNALKRTQGVTVKDLAGQLGMSYMGIKGVCADLLRRGLLESWREPRPIHTAGRPRLVYRLTSRAHDLFPAASNPLTREILEATRKLHGPAAPEKLLHFVWQQKGAHMAERIKGASVVERAECLTQVREAEGHMAIVEEGTRIVEHHCPYLDVLREYPVIAKLETDLFTRLLGVSVRREEHCAGGLFRTDYHFAEA